jgi:uncharacterized membrane protein
MKVKTITQNAIIASLYIVLTLMPPLNAIAFGPIQFRISEALLMLILFRKDFLFGVVIGTFFANLFGPLGGTFAIIDAVVGSLVTILAGVWMGRNKNVWIAIIGPIVFNGIYLAFFLPFALLLPFTFPVILTTFASVAFGEAVVLIGLGMPLYQLIKRTPFLKQILGNN